MVPWTRRRQGRLRGQGVGKDQISAERLPGGRFTRGHARVRRSGVIPDSVVDLFSGLVEEKEEDGEGDSAVREDVEL